MDSHSGYCWKVATVVLIKQYLIMCNYCPWHALKLNQNLKNKLVIVFHFLGLGLEIITVRLPLVKILYH